MGIFDKIGTSEEAAAKEESLGGDYISDTGEYDMKVVMAFAVSSQSSDAMGIYVKFEDEKGRQINETTYISYKDGNTFKTDKNKKVIEHFGFTHIKRLHQLLTGKKTMPDTSKKEVMVYDHAQSKEVPQEKDVIVEWIGKPVTVLLKKTVENKTAKNTDTDEWEKTNDKKTYMKIDFVLDPASKKTVSEMDAGKDAVIHKEWTDKYDKTYVNDKFESVSGAASSDDSEGNKDGGQSAFGKS